jgi:crotonobetainyl-CoA:carnitine CoA-transferase CaiB-like acyl-CoA transferase
MITHQPVNNHDDMRMVTDNILRDAGMTIDDSGGKVTFDGADPVRKTVVKVGSAVSCILAANAVTDAAIWKERTGEGQDIHVDLRKAWIEQSPWQADAMHCTLINGVSKAWNPNVVLVNPGFTRTRDGRHMVRCWMYPSQVQHGLELLNCGPTDSQVASAVGRRDAVELEEAAEAVQVPLQMVRTKEEWEATEQGQIQAELPLVHIEKIADGPTVPLPQGERPLSGLKCLEFVHAVAGPIVGRTLAMQGAECLNINMPDWVEFGNFFYVAQTGQRQAYLDARLAENRKHMYKLVEEADVFLENLRPDLASQEGYSPQALAERNPGIIYVSVKLCTDEGPFRRWPGYDVSAGGFCGLNTAEGTPDHPELMHQVNVVCDILTGYLGAIGIKAALLRRATEGGSYVVRVTLSQTVMYMASLGFIDKRIIDDYENLGEQHQILEPNLVTGTTVLGEYMRPASQVEMSKTPQFWDDPILHMMGASEPVWMGDGKEKAAGA